MSEVTLNSIVRWLKTPEGAKLQVWGSLDGRDFDWVDVPVFILQPDGSVKPMEIKK